MKSQALAEQPPLPVEPQSSEPVQLVTMIERMASNPDVSVDKLERLMAMHERMLSIQAKAAFDEAFIAMRAKLPIIIARKKGDKNKYAPIEDISEVITPILTANGFSLTHSSEWPTPTTVKVIGILTHKQGHERRSEFLSAADSSGSKNAIQGLGSAISYGRRYTTNDLLNIVTRDEDDDAKRTALAEAPEGYDDWLWSLSDVADKGLKALQDAWQKGPKQYRERLNKIDAYAWSQFKARAAKVTA